MQEWAHQYIRVRLRVRMCGWVRVRMLPRVRVYVHGTISKESAWAHKRIHDTVVGVPLTPRPRVLDLSVRMAVVVVDAVAVAVLVVVEMVVVVAPLSVTTLPLARVVKGVPKGVVGG